MIDLHIDYLLLQLVLDHLDLETIYNYFLLHHYSWLNQCVVDSMLILLLMYNKHPMIADHPQMLSMLMTM